MHRDKCNSACYRGVTAGGVRSSYETEAARPFRSRVDATFPFRGLEVDRRGRDRHDKCDEQLTVPVSRDDGQWAGGRWRYPRRTSLTVGAIVGTLLLAACGGGTAPQAVAHIGKDAPTTTVASATGSGPFANLQQMYSDALSYAGCMRSHGDPGFPNPILVNTSRSRGVEMGNGVNTSTPQYRSANRACDHLLPNDGNGPTQAQIQEAMNRLLKYAKCMRAHGVPNFPDPTESNGGKAVGFSGSGADPNSPQVQSAQKTCRDLSPFGPD